MNSGSATPGPFIKPMKSPNGTSFRESQEKVSSEATPHGADFNKEQTSIQRTRKPFAEFKQVTSSEEIRENVEEEKSIPHVNFRDDPVNSVEPPSPIMSNMIPESKRQKSSILAMFTNFFSSKAEGKEDEEEEEENLGSV